MNGPLRLLPDVTIQDDHMGEVAGDGFDLRFPGQLAHVVEQSERILQASQRIRGPLFRLGCHALALYRRCCQ